MSPRPLTQAEVDVMAERARLRCEAPHCRGDMARAAALYASLSTLPEAVRSHEDRRSDLVLAGALILAEIEQMDAAAHDCMKDTA